MEEFKGKMFHIAHTHYMGKAGSLSWGGGKTKEYLRWERQQALRERQQTINEEAKIPKEYYYDEGVCELKVKDPIKVKEEPKIYPWTDFNYIHLGSNKSGYSGVNN